VLSIDHEAYNAIDKDELFMECVRAYESGEEWQLNKSELAALDEMGTEFETTPFERELILGHFAKPKPGVYSTWMTSTEIKDHIETMTKQKIFGTKRFGIELRRVFGHPVSKKVEGISMKRYEVIKLRDNTTTAETRANIEEYDDTPF
jgi:hypothetical protein